MIEHKKVCIVEDNLPVNKLFCTLLKKGGFDAISFQNGISAIDWLKYRKSDIIILDILLPDMRGTELIDLIKSTDINSKTPVIAVTAFAAPSDKLKFLEHGFVDYLPKPINTNTFVEQVKVHLQD